MTLLVDLNIVLDVLLERDPWVAEGALLMSAIEQGKAAGHVSGHTVTTVFYLIEKVTDRKTAKLKIAELLRIFAVVPLDRQDFAQALLLDPKDYEDAVQGIAAMKIGADYIVTRNPRDFRGFESPPVTPGEILAQLEISAGE